MVSLEFTSRQQGVDETQAEFRSLAHGACNGSIEFDNWGTLDGYQPVVKHQDLVPVCGSRRFRLSMNSRNRGLQCVRTEVARRQCSPRVALALGLIPGLSTSNESKGLLDLPNS